METMHAAGRRSLPPVPRTTAAPAPATDQADADVPAREPVHDAESVQDARSAHDAESQTERFVVDLTTGEQRRVGVDTLPDDAADLGDADARADAVEPVPDGARAEDRDLDPAQQFVALLRATAGDFAEAAGAESAVVREAVPPARHRRARCRLVLRYADSAEVDVTFLGQAGRPGTPSRHGFDRHIRRWLAAGQRRDDAWLVADEDAPDGLAVDLSAWVTAAA